MQERCTFLRSLFKLDDSSPLGPGSRNVRNAIEHWDEKLQSEKWFERLAPTGKFEHPLYIGSFDELHPESFPIRRYDPSLNLVASGHAILALNPALEQVRWIAFRASQVMGYMHDISQHIWEHSEGTVLTNLSSRELLRP